MNETKEWSIFVFNTGAHYICPEDRNLLKAMIQLGRNEISSGCHGGGCGVCKIRILSGQVKVKAMSRAHISAEEEQEGLALACRVYPRSDLSLEVVGKIPRLLAGRSRSVSSP